MFRKPALLLSAGKDAPNLVNTLDQAIPVSGHHTNTQLVEIRAWEQLKLRGPPGSMSLYPKREVF